MNNNLAGLTPNEKANLAFSVLNLLSASGWHTGDTEELRARAIQELENALEPPADIQQLP